MWALVTEITPRFGDEVMIRRVYSHMSPFLFSRPWRFQQYWGDEGGPFYRFRSTRSIENFVTRLENLEWQIPDGYFNSDYYDEYEDD